MRKYNPLKQVWRYEKWHYRYMWRNRRVVAYIVVLQFVNRFVKELVKQAKSKPTPRVIEDPSMARQGVVCVEADTYEEAHAQFQAWVAAQGGNPLLADGLAEARRRNVDWNAVYGDPNYTV